jgi:hypothetical protein
MNLTGLKNLLLGAIIFATMSAGTDATTPNSSIQSSGSNDALAPNLFLSL